jgi:glutathione S-transferase
MTQRVLYSAYFCPYAQRVWACLNHFRIPYDLQEALGSGMDAAYTKHPDLLKWNPKGLVPTLVTRRQEENNDQVVQVQCESIDILRDLYFEQQGKNNELLLDRLHNEAVEWNKLICSPFYRVLMKPDEAGRQAAWQDMVKGLSAFSDNLALDGDESISFYNYNGKESDDEPSLVDFTVFPFVHRLYIIEHYRGFRLADADVTVGDKIQRWQQKMEALSSVRDTIADRQPLIDVYLRYADGSAQSKVGDAVRSGKEAHDI